METRHSRKRKEELDELNLLKKYDYNPPYLLLLPQPCAEAIIKFLPMHEVLRSLLICKHWNTFVKSSHVWKVIRPGRNVNVTVQILDRLAETCNYKVVCLDLTYSQIDLSKDFIKLLRKIAPNLKVLKLPHRNNGINKRGLSAISQYCKELRHLYLNTVEKLNDDLLVGISTSNKELVSIYINWSSITVRGLKGLIEKCLKLDKLCIAHIAMDAEKLTPYFKNIKELTIHRSSTKGAYSLLKALRLKHLTKLECYHSDDLFDYFMERLMTNCPNLKSMAIVDCRELSNLGIAQMAELGCNLKRVLLGGDFYGAPNNAELADEALEDIANMSSTITHVSVGTRLNITCEGIQNISSVRPLTLEIIDRHPIKAQYEEQNRNASAFQIDKLSISFVKDFFDNYEVHNVNW